MKQTILNCPVSLKSKGKNTWKVEGFASTEEQDRDGDVILPSAFRSSRSQYLKRGGVLLWMHDRSQPIGKVTSADIKEKGVWISAEISKAKPEVWQLCQDCPLSFSVGFVPDRDGTQQRPGYKGNLVNDLEWLETSVVSLPSNRATFLQVAKSLDLENKGYTLDVAADLETVVERTVERLLSGIGQPVIVETENPDPRPMPVSYLTPMGRVVANYGDIKSWEHRTAEKAIDAENLRRRLSGEPPLIGIEADRYAQEALRMEESIYA